MINEDSYDLGYDKGYSDAKEERTCDCGTKYIPQETGKDCCGMCVLKQIVEDRNEPKTLKDFKTGVISKETEFKLEYSKTKIHKLIEGYNDVLKAEAIRWIKELDEKGFYMKDTGATNGFWIMIWIKHFFNITEEDLDAEDKKKI